MRRGWSPRLRRGRADRRQPHQGRPGPEPPGRVLHHRALAGRRPAGARSVGERGGPAGPVTVCHSASSPAKTDIRGGRRANHSRMSARRVPVLAAAVAALLLLPRRERAALCAGRSQGQKDIEQKMTQAMENYDLLEYEEARKILNQALTIAKKAKIESDPDHREGPPSPRHRVLRRPPGSRERQAVVPERRRDRQVDRPRQGPTRPRRCRSSWPRPRPKRAAAATLAAATPAAAIPAAATPAAAIPAATPRWPSTAPP
jgi:hypothetical protein